MTTTLLHQKETYQSSARLPQAASRLKNRSLVSIVIPCYNQAHFLPEAIETVLQQTYTQHEIIVVDDGSTDNTAETAQKYPVRYIYQSNQGLPAARNTGIRLSRGEFIVLLDSDDRLFPHALECGLRVLEAYPNCMMASGDFSFVSANGTWMRPSGRQIVTENHYQALLRSNFIEMTATCLFRKEIFNQVGLFDSSLRASEDYELYLRVVRNAEVVCYPTVVAEYRSHGNSMSKDGERMLNETLRVVQLQKEHVGSPAEQKAYRQGIRFWRKLYGRHLAAQLALQETTRQEGYVRKLKLLARHYPPGLFIHLFRRLVPGWVNQKLNERELKRLGWVPTSQVKFGNLRSVVPVGRVFDLNRGTSIHNYYAQKSLSAYKKSIQGRVLYLGEPAAFEHFKESARVWLEPDDFRGLQTLTLEQFQEKAWSASQFDCVLVSDCLEYLPSPDLFLTQVKRLLKPNGVVLALLPGLQNGHRQRGARNLHWHFTSHSASNLFERYFERESIEVTGCGNVLTAVAALHGLVAEELEASEMEMYDPAYEVTILARAVNA